MNLADLKESFIPSCFEGRGWDKLLGVCEPLIREFYANASLKEDHIKCWVKGRAFTLDMGALMLYLNLKNKIMKGSFHSRTQWSL